MPNKPKTVKGGNSLLSTMLAAGQQKEKEMVSATINQEPAEKNIQSISDIIPEIEKLSELSEKEKDPEIPIVEKSQPEKEQKTQIPLSEKKLTYSELLKKRTEKESVEKGNFLTPHRDILKRIAMAEGISLQDLTANIIEEFLFRYRAEIKQSTKKLLM